MGVSFIKDKLEIKFLILYVMSRMAQPLSLAGVQELTMIDDGVDYFAFSECLNDLVSTDHLYVTEAGEYGITPKGMKNSKICEEGLPYSVRLKADKVITVFQNTLRRSSQVKGKVIARDNGTYTVDLTLNDDVDNVMHLQLMAATDSMAKELVRRFEKAPEETYGRILAALFEEEK